MAKISKSDVKKLAQLSAIKMDDEEIDSFKTQIESILKYVEQLQNIDTDGVKPTTQVTGLKNVMRKDVIDNNQAKQSDLMKNLPEKHNNMIKVPKVL